MKATSLFDRLIGRRRPVWLTLLVSLALLSLPFLAVYLDGGLGEVTRRGEWRVLLLPPVIIIYILLVTPLMMRMGERVLEALRPLVLLDDAEFQHLVETVQLQSCGSEVVGIGIGEVRENALDNDVLAFKRFFEQGFGAVIVHADAFHPSINFEMHFGDFFHGPCCLVDQL